MSNSCKTIKVSPDLAKVLSEAIDWPAFWAALAPIILVSSGKALGDLKGQAMDDLRRRLVPALNAAKVTRPTNLRTGQPFKGWSYAVIAGAMYVSGYRSF
jgi:hypothetical protein